MFEIEGVVQFTFNSNQKGEIENLTFVSNGLQTVCKRLN
jgi:hypothetical protein